MLFGNVVRGLGLDKTRAGGLQITARYCSLLQERITGVKDALRNFKVRLGLSQIELGLLQVFHDAGFRCGHINWHPPAS